MNIELFKDLKYVGPDIVMQHYKPWHIIEIPKKLSNQNEFLYVLNVAHKNDLGQVTYRSLGLTCVCTIDELISNFKIMESDGSLTDLIDYTKEELESINKELIYINSLIDNLSDEEISDFFK